MYFRIAIKPQTVVFTSTNYKTSIKFNLIFLLKKDFINATFRVACAVRVFRTNRTNLCETCPDDKGRCPCDTNNLLPTIRKPTQKAQVQMRKKRTLGNQKKSFHTPKSNGSFSNRGKNSHGKSKESRKSTTFDLNSTVTNKLHCVCNNISNVTDAHLYRTNHTKTNSSNTINLTKWINETNIPTTNISYIKQRTNCACTFIDSNQSKQESILYQCTSPEWIDEKEIWAEETWKLAIKGHFNEGLKNDDNYGVNMTTNQPIVGKIKHLIRKTNSERMS